LSRGKPPGSCRAGADFKAAGDCAEQQARIEQVVAAFQKKLPVVICPGCNKPMKPGKPKSITKDLADVTYVCEHCGTKTERTIKEG
jgi:RNase P subunit RPR2